jgi:hypothetical protein
LICECTHHKSFKIIYGPNEGPMDLSILQIIPPFLIHAKILHVNIEKVISTPD